MFDLFVLLAQKVRFRENIRLDWLVHRVDAPLGWKDARVVEYLFFFGSLL